MPNLSVMIKPASGLCNMRCRYCFYADEMAMRETPNYGMMSEETLENVIRKVIAASSSVCTIAFQGGRANPGRAEILSEGGGAAEAA